MTIDEEALNEGWAAFYHSDKPAPFNCFRDGVEAYEQAKKPAISTVHVDDFGNVAVVPNSPANTAVLVGATCRCGAKMMVSENFKPDTALVKKLVDAMQLIKAAMTMHEWNRDLAEKDLEGLRIGMLARIEEALTEAQAWLERQGKCGEGWQPIETAPKDGIRYLGMIVGDRFYGEPFVCYYDEDEGHICLHQTEARLHRPTHWMPLPKPPTTSQQEARE